MGGMKMAELLKTIDRPARPETILAIDIGESLVPLERELETDYFVLGNKHMRDLVLAATIAGPTNMAPEYVLLNLGKVPRGMTLNLVAEKYRDDWEKYKSFGAMGYRAIDMPEMLSSYRHIHDEEPECLLVVKPRFANRVYVVKESSHARGAFIMESGILLSDYNGEYEETMLAIGRPLLYNEVEYLPLES